MPHNHGRRSCVARAEVSVPAEAARIQAAGGFVKMGDSATTARVYADKTMCNGPGLAIARALGDCGASEIGVIATPEVITHRLTPDDRFLVRTMGTRTCSRAWGCLALQGARRHRGWCG